MESLFNTICLGATFLVLFSSAEWFYHKRQVEAEFTRKYVHLSTGLLTLLFPILIGNHWLVLLLCSSFLVILLASLKWNLLPSINAVDRVTRGSVLYPIIVYICFIIYQQYDQFLFFYIPILILAVCDPIAALVGKGWPRGPYTIFGHSKTLSGSMGFFCSALIITFAFVFDFKDLSILQVIASTVVLALISTFAEAISHKGYDNLTIPLSVITVLISLKELNFIG